MLESRADDTSALARRPEPRRNILPRLNKAGVDPDQIETYYVSLIVSWVRSDLKLNTSLLLKERSAAWFSTAGFLESSSEYTQRYLFCTDGSEEENSTRCAFVSETCGKDSHSLRRGVHETRSGIEITELYGIKGIGTKFSKWYSNFPKSFLRWRREGGL